jgi:hypothetical protein
MQIYFYNSIGKIIASINKINIWLEKLGEMEFISKK